jgi:hypothetical protein
VCSGVGTHGETVHGDAISRDGAERRGDEWGVSWIYRGVGGGSMIELDMAAGRRATR